MNVLADSGTPAHFRLTTIGEICDEFGGEVQTGPFGSQLHASDYSDDGIPVVMPQDMVDGRISCVDIARVDESHARRLGQHRLRVGDIVFSRRGDVSRFAVVTESEEGWLCGTGSIRIRPNCPEIDLGYLRHFLKRDEVGRWLHYHAKGVTMPNLNTSIIRAIPFSFPSLDEQRRIAAILDKADALRRKRRRAIELLDHLTHSIFLEMFGDLIANASNKKNSCSLGEVAEIVSGITKGRKLNGESVREVPYMAVSNVQDKHLDLAVVKTIDATEAEIERYLLRKDDLLLTEGGDPDKLGRGTLWADELEESIHQNHIFRVRITSSEVRPLYLIWLVGSAYGKAYFLRSAKQTTGIASINKTQLSEFPVLVPPLSKQIDFENRVAVLKKTSDAVARSSQSTESLFASIQDRAFRGEL
ncbi:restriction endonuclease subunit S [Bradyrhizobium sp. HKCCYLRH3083]|uniref:restriction endonuclease subunit S n=1 Tax=unclassified Bradyrhizobium TaxID=2631580 RepID=UPI003EB6EB07